MRELLLLDMSGAMSDRATGEANGSGQVAHGFVHSVQ
jgi:hypothetical protein